MIIAGTGHRPDKLGGYGQDIYNKLVKVSTKYLIECAPEEVISGMALGWDQALAEAAINLDIPVTAAIPFKGQESMWPQSSIEKYNYILNKSFSIVYVSSPGYAVWKMHTRNEWMVDHSDRIVALWDGSTGGTGSCVKYATKQGKEYDNLWDIFKRS